MSKKKKIVLVIAVLLVVGLGIGAFLYFRKKSKLTDKNRNVFELTTIPHPKVPADFGVLVNGVLNGGLVSIRLGSNGFVEGTNALGLNYRFTDKWVDA